MTGREGSAHHPRGTIGFRIGTDCPTGEEQVIRPGGAQGPQWDIGKALASQIDEAHTARRLMHFHRSEEHTSELQSLMRISYAVFCLKKKKNKHSNSKNT